MRVLRWSLLAGCAVAVTSTATAQGSSSAASRVALENEYVRVLRDSAPCASAGKGCGDRVIVALGATHVHVGNAEKALVRGDIQVYLAGEKYAAPTGGPYFEVAFKPEHPPVIGPKETILPDKNVVKFDGERLFIFEERLPVGEFRPRHSHSQRVVVQLNKTKLLQKPDGEPEVTRDIIPDGAGFNPAVIHTAKNIGELPLRGIVIELNPTPGPRLRK